MADELYKLTIHGNHNGQHSECGMYFHGSNLTANEVFESATDLLQSWQNDCIAEFLNLMPTTYQITRISARRIVPTGGIEVAEEFQNNVQVGSSTGTAASNQLCPVVRLIPPMGTKSAGKFFLPCISEGDINGNLVQPGWEGNLASLMGFMLSNFGANAIVWLLAVYSPQLGTYVDAVNYDTSGTVGWQRRRARPH